MIIIFSASGTCCRGLNRGGRLSGDLTEGGCDEGYVQIAVKLEEQAYPTLLLPGNSDDQSCMRQTWGNERGLPDSSGKLPHFSYNAGVIYLADVGLTVSEQSYGLFLKRMRWLEK
ncbi:metallophosphoesterase [Pantoea sp. S62]|nr:metallophosphoesterase [Pantoea sp. S62]